MYIALFKIGWLPWWTYHYKMISVRKPMIFKSWICLCVVCVVVCTVQCCSTAVQVKFDVTDNPECAFWVWKYTNGRQMSECCKMIPMILTIDLNSLKYDKIGSTPDAAFPRLFVFRAITFRCILFFLNLRMEFMVIRVVKRGTVSGGFRRTEHGRPTP